MPAYERSWTFSLDNNPNDESDLTQQCRSFLYQYKTFLVGTAGWSVVASSDSSSYGSSDKWTSLATIVAGTGAHSWIVLKSPEGIVAGDSGTYTGDQSRIWLIVDCSLANYYQVKISQHRLEPSGGSTSACPTSSYSYVPSARQFLRSSLTGGAKFHFACTDRGHFYALASYTGITRINYASMVVPVVAEYVISSTGKDYPYAIAYMDGYNDAGNGFIFSMSTFLIGWPYDGAAASASMYPTVLATTSGPIGAGFTTGSTGPNGDTFYTPIWLSSMHSGKQCIVGRIQDIYMTGQTVNVTTTDGPPITMIKINGNIWLPVNAAIAM